MEEYQEAKMYLTHENLKTYYRNGRLQFYCFFFNDTLSGEFKAWHENGQFNISCFYIKGLRDGEYKEWNEDGKLEKHEIYKNGELIEILNKEE